MVTATRPEVDTRVPETLRPAALDARDAAIVLAVAKRWADHGGVTYRDLERDTGLPLSSLVLLIWKNRRHSLIASGWITQDKGANRTLRPGPRFGGMQRKAGIIYERAASDPMAHRLIRAGRA